VLPRALVIDGADTRCCKQHIAPLYGGGLYKPDARNGDMAAAREKNDGAAKTIQDGETGETFATDRAYAARKPRDN